MIHFLESGPKLEAATQALMVSGEARFFGQGYSQDVPRGMTGLHVAACFGLVDAAKELLRRGHSADSNDSHGRTAVVWGAQRGHAGIVQLLLQNPENMVSAANWKDRNNPDALVVCRRVRPSGCHRVAVGKRKG